MKIGTDLFFIILIHLSGSEYGIREFMGSKYQGQEGPTPSKSHNDFNNL